MIIIISLLQCYKKANFNFKPKELNICCNWLSTTLPANFNSRKRQKQYGHAGYDCRKSISQSWEFTSYGSTMMYSGQQQLPLRVLSYNVLAQDLLEQHRYLYRDCQEENLGWERRWKLILHEIVKANADIICLQEVQESLVENYYNKELSELGYEGIFKKRTTVRVDGVGLWYRRSLLRLNNWSAIEFRVPSEPLLNRDNVAIVAKLSPLTAGWRHWSVVVATTHLLYNMKRHDVKLAQTQLLLAEVEAQAYRWKMPGDRSPQYWPVIVTGDLNLKPLTGVYTLLVDGRLEYEGLCARTLRALDSGDSGRRLEKRLLSPELGITDSCQYINEIISRLQVQFGVSLGHCVAPTLAETLHNITAACPVMKHHPSLRLNSGTLTHPLNLKSVYTHGRLGTDEQEVTSSQENGTTVDYIFYSATPGGEAENNLKLAARYQLFTRREAKQVGPIPNGEHPSDHFPLVAQFVLVP